MTGLNSLTLGEIQKIRDESKNIHGSVDSFYYRTRPEQIKDFYERFGKMQQHLRTKGIENDTENIQRKVLLPHKYNLDNGALYLHYYAFMPAVELLASEYQAKKWLPLIRELKITGAYAQTEIGHGSDV
jgi:hypothetical protein